MKISALFINYNSSGTILKSIQSVVDQEISLENILVVDNGSTDGGVEEIRQIFPHVHVRELGENRGLSYARNVGLKLLNEDLVLLIDDDVYLSKDALKLLIKAYQETGASVICPRIVLYSETDIIQCDGAAVHFVGMLTLRHSYQLTKENAPLQSMVGGFIGACLLLERKTLIECGAFDEDYFFYFEDMELTYRLLALGKQVCCEERAVAFHDRGEGTENLSFRGSGIYPARRAYFNLRHRWLTILIHYQARTLVILFSALLLYEFVAFIVAIQRGWMKEYFRAIFSLIKILPSIVEKRKRWMLKRKVGDAKILIGGELPFSRGFTNSKQSRLINLLTMALNWYWGVVKTCL